MERLVLGAACPRWAGMNCVVFYQGVYVGGWQQLNMALGIHVWEWEHMSGDIWDGLLCSQIRFDRGFHASGHDEE